MNEKSPRNILADNMIAQHKIFKAILDEKYWTGKNACKHDNITVDRDPPTGNFGIDCEDCGMGTVKTVEELRLIPGLSWTMKL